MSDPRGPLVDTCIVVPCYNEQHRIRLDDFHTLISPTTRLLFVDDGSTDRTAKLLSDWSEARPGAEVLCLGSNSGKAEAVRAGIVRAIDEGAEYVAYFDADLASPPQELFRIIDLVRSTPAIDVALGARIAILGADIERTRARHFQGRIFATIASMILDLRVYDTQCGLKVFRVNPTLVEAFSEPFRSKWIFDVELLMRLLRGTTPLAARAIIEVPLREWRDVGGSSLGFRARCRSLADLAAIGWRHRTPRLSHHRTRT